MVAYLVGVQIVEVTLNIGDAESGKSYRIHQSFGAIAAGSFHIVES